MINKRKAALGISLVLILSGCGQSQSNQKTPEVTSEELLTKACKTWAEGLKSGRNVPFTEYVIMPIEAANLFDQVAELDPKQSTLGKSAFLMALGNGRNPADWDSGYKTLFASASAELVAAYA